MSTASVLAQVRRMLGDYGQIFTSRVGGDNLTQIFELTEDTVEPTSVVANLINADGTGMPETLVQGTDYNIDGPNGIVTTTNPVGYSQILVVTGIAYEDFTDEDLLDYITIALGLHTAGRSPVPALDPNPGSEPPTYVLNPIEERPVALLAAREAVRDLATQVAKDITIDTGDGTVIPRSQRYQQLVAEAARLDSEYSELVDKLGLPGFDQITTLSLRRVSMTTNRFVPIYRPREWDDPTYPQRVLPAIPTGALPTDRLITYRGQYLAGAQYNVNDLVDEGGVRYLCLAVTTVDPATDVATGPDGIHGAFWEISYINAGMWGYSTGAW